MLVRRAGVVGLRAERGVRPRSDAPHGAASYGVSVRASLGPRTPVVGDVGLAAGLAAFGLAEMLVGPFADSVALGPTWLNIVAVVGLTRPVAFRRRVPLAACAVFSAGLAGRAVAADPLELFAPVLAAVVRGAAAQRGAHGRAHARHGRH